MGFRQHFFDDLNLILSELDGALDDTLLELDIQAQGEAAAGLVAALELVDLRFVTSVEGLTASGVLQTAALENEQAHVEGGRCAMLVADELVFGFARMYGAISGQAREVEVGYDLDALLGWLGVAEHRERIVGLLPPGPGIRDLGPESPRTSAEVRARGPAIHRGGGQGRAPAPEQP